MGICKIKEYKNTLSSLLEAAKICLSRQLGCVTAATQGKGGRNSSERVGSWAATVPVPLCDQVLLATVW